MTEYRSRLSYRCCIVQHTKMNGTYFFATYSTSRKDVECKFGCIRLEEFLQFVSWQEKQNKKQNK